ncbi:MAG TPA: hypothetical protein VMG31_05050 [Verrucomicrobiae bacterium]|nr:hypothetical protein [Verrucomicrobiae bacterium]
MSHISPPSAPANIPDTHVAPPANAPARNSETMGSESSPGRAAPVAHEPPPGTGRIVPNQKITGEHGIASAPRIGENPPDKDKPEKPAPDLRHRVCLNGSCPDETAKPTPPESDLRHRVCVTGPCSCPAGQSWSKNGCVASGTPEQPNACPPGQVWNGSSCVVSQTCLNGEWWNGAACVSSVAECASIESRAEIIISEWRSLKAQIELACGQSPPTQECEDLKQQRQGVLQRYQMLLTEAPPACRGMLADLGSLQ